MYYTLAALCTSSCATMISPDFAILEWRKGPRHPGKILKKEAFILIYLSILCDFECHDPLSFRQWTHLLVLELGVNGLRRPHFLDSFTACMYEICLCCCSLRPHYLALSLVGMCPVIIQFCVKGCFSPEPWRDAKYPLRQPHSDLSMLHWDGCPGWLFWCWGSNPETHTCLACAS